MKEKLIIKNFGPIKSVELDLGRFNILIGEQATGKSTVAKVLAVCRYFSYIIDELGTFPKDVIISSFIEGLEAWGLSEYTHNDSYIHYSCKHYLLTVTSTKITARTIIPEISTPVDYFLLKPKLEPISQEFKNLLAELDKIKPKESNNPKAIAFTWRIPFGFFTNDVKNVLDNPFYLPTERGLQSMFSLGQGSIPTLASFLYKYFATVDDILSSFSTETDIEPLNIIYKYTNGKGYIKKKNDKEFYLLANAASGYQSIIPIVLVMKFYENKKRKKTFLVEEPELNLFPTAQNRLMQYLVDKTINYANSILLTTQSPYILASVNNLIYAHLVGQFHKEAVNDIISEQYWLDPSLVSAYRLYPDGTAKNIIDPDLNEIIVEELNGAGKEINSLYDKILDIKFKKNEESK